jgi:Icc-related predicted phosphoesterase
MHGTQDALQDFQGWCGRLLDERRVRKIMIIAGNHDFLFEQQPSKARAIFERVTYLQDEGVEWEGLHFYGTPWQPWFYDWAFNLRTETELREKFRQIPKGLDVLVSHGPPRGILDRTYRGDSVGSIALQERIEEVRPRLVVFGHIHEAYGMETRGATLYVNASCCDVRYRPVQPPVLIEL